MSDVTESGGLHVDTVESGTAALTDPISLLKKFENTLDISQDVGQTESAASEETDGKIMLQQEDGQQDDRPQDGQTESPPESKWVEGTPCWAVWSEDGQLYPGRVVSVDGERCRVRFNDYGNEEDVELNVLRSTDAAQQTQTQNTQDWGPGSRCRAVFSEDGLVYPAVVLWVKGQRCLVRFDDYNNEEEQDVGSLLTPDELRGPSRTSTAKGSSWRSSSDWRRRRKEEQQGERGAERRRRDEQHSSSWVKEKPDGQEEKEKRGAEKPTSHSFSFFPPFPPPPQTTGGSGSASEPPTFIPPPPPPLWMLGGNDWSSSAAANASSSMLMLWYMCGFHTGCYLAQQEFKSNPKH